MVKTAIFGIGFSIKIWLKFFGAVVLQPRFFFNNDHPYIIIYTKNPACRPGFLFYSVGDYFVNAAGNALSSRLL
ncbi:hypothetical protein SAMN05444266_105238 [Chitinophaga jiangningensis]|uniref:Uncharacterized protein n=1 Tax=Chitinophaga jiangningensis TaxID=1419482 RepID=A0A1M7E1L7_9BACT|nr:hypothetical protein SAMN05444266_105238 [Chitinophaga jiangningensis]